MSPPLSVSTDLAPRSHPGVFFGAQLAPRSTFSVPTRVPASSIRVLIVDDHDDAAESLAIVLSTEGFEVRTDNDGADAWQTIENWRPSVALIDLDLPSMGGLELARRARSLAFGDQLLLAAVTGYGRDSDRHTSEQAGFDAHMVKPVDPNEVLRWITTASVSRAR